MADKPFVLIVEDDFLIADATDRVLAQAGYRVATSPSAEAALVLARIDAPDLAIVDLALTDGMSGAEATWRLRELGCAIVVCTGFEGSLAEKWLERVRPASILAKPVSSADLLEAVRGALGAIAEADRTKSKRRRRGASPSGGWPGWRARRGR